MHRLQKLPFNNQINTLNTCKYLSEANMNIGELNGIMKIIPNLGIILKLISIKEAKDSVGIDKKDTLFDDYFIDYTANKKVTKLSTDMTNCMRALNIGFHDLGQQQSISKSMLTSLQEIIAPEHIGIRTLPGLKIYNKNNSRVILIPPQNKDAIHEYFENLILYMNNSVNDYDPLIQAALIHYQFECIHPYKDGNGRLGRIINILYLIHQEKLTYPVLNLSKYLYDTNKEYFTLLKKCHNDITCIEEFIIYFLKGIITTSRYTINTILKIDKCIKTTNKKMMNELPTIYNNKITDHIFKFIYTKNELFRTELSLSRATATKYLKLLENKGFITSTKVGKEVLYKNSMVDEIFK